MVQVKICGITNLEDAKAAVKAGADLLGFVFADSPRRITPETALGIINQLPGSVLRVGLFVNEAPEKIDEILNICKLDFLQFHGDETPEFCQNFGQRAEIIKAFRIKDKRSLVKLKDFQVDGYLLDAYLKGKSGGTGKSFDWNLAVEAKAMASRIILSGGLNPDNVADAVKKVAPYAVDVSSGVESSPGKKDFDLMRRFIKNAKANT